MNDVGEGGTQYQGGHQESIKLVGKGIYLESRPSTSSPVNKLDQNSRKAYREQVGTSFKSQDCKPSWKFPLKEEIWPIPLDVRLKIFNKFLSSVSQHFLISLTPAADRNGLRSSPAHRNTEENQKTDRKNTAASGKAAWLSWREPLAIQEIVSKAVDKKLTLHIKVKFTVSINSYKLDVA